MAPPRIAEVITIEPVTDAIWERFAADFARVPTFNWCWCQYWRLRSKDFGALKVPQLRERLRALAARSMPPGLVAMEPARGGEPARAVGWVSLGPRDDYQRIVRSKVIPKIDDRPVWSIVCFAVSKAARGRGVARALLDGAIGFARAQGAEALEAYPVRADDGEGIQPESAFTGTLPMFERAGFTVVAERASDPTASRPRVVVRMELGARS